jgi:hypothetical protein
MTIGNRKLAISIRNITRTAGIVFSQPNVCIMDLSIAVGKLSRKSNAIYACILKRNPAARDNSNAVICRISSVNRNGISSIDCGSSLSSRIPK